MIRSRKKKRKKLLILRRAMRNLRKTKSFRKNPSNKKHEKPRPFDVLLQDEQPQQNQNTNLVLILAILKIPKTTMKMNSTKTSIRRFLKNKSCRCQFPRTDDLAKDELLFRHMIKSSAFAGIYFVPICSFIQKHTVYCQNCVFERFYVKINLIYLMSGCLFFSEL